MQFLYQIQSCLEECYGATTGLDVRDFVRESSGFGPLGELLVEQNDPDDIGVALLFDRDVLAAWESSRPRVLPNSRQVSVPFEEVSHFVYLSFNHARGRNVTGLEMEMQSEVDRILLAFHGGFECGTAQKDELLVELMNQTYNKKNYEEARRAAAAFIHGLSGGDPNAWSPAEFCELRRFFHSDLSEKMRLARRRS